MRSEQGNEEESLNTDVGGVDPGDVGEGTYQIGPYTVTPGDDASGLMAYVVRMQAALNEAIQAIHENEVKVNQLSSQLSQITEEKNHAVSKLNVVTRTAQERDQQYKKAKVELQKLKRDQAEEEKKGPRKTAAEAKQKFSETRDELRACRKEMAEMKIKMTKAETEHRNGHVRVGALEEELALSTRRHQSLEEQRTAAQEQVHALNWKLQAFEGQYAALYQQYAHYIQPMHSAQGEPDIPRLVPATIMKPDGDGETTDSHEKGSLDQGPQSNSSANILIAQGTLSAPNEGTYQLMEGKTHMPGSKPRRRQHLPSWVPEWLAHRLFLRSTPRLRLLVASYVFALHVLLAIWIFSPSCSSLSSTQWSTSTE